MASDYDIIVNGVKARVFRGEQPGYTRRMVRQEVESNVLSQAGRVALASRMDTRQLLQSSWVGGATWWKPMLNDDNLSTYHTANLMDVWSEPGLIRPANKFDETATSLHDNNIVAHGLGTQLYAIGITDTTNASFLDVYEYVSGVWTRVTGAHSGIADTTMQPMAMIYNPTDAFYYCLVDTGSAGKIVKFKSDTNGADVVTGLNRPAPGSNIFIHNQEMLVWDGTLLSKIVAGVASTIYNDGQGVDALNGAAIPAAPLFFKGQLRLAVSTPEGVFIVKNTRQAGNIVAWVTRVMKDAAGNYIGAPIATLPVDEMAMSALYHMGQLVVTATPMPDTALINTAGNPGEVFVYFLGEGGMGALGSVLGQGTSIDMPFNLLGSVGPRLYLGGRSRIFVYDAVAGGLHPVYAAGVDDGNQGTFSVMFNGKDVAANSNVRGFLAGDRMLLQETRGSDGASIAAHTDSTPYSLESNYFDGGLPMEEKVLTKAKLIMETPSVDGGGQQQRWHVYISADDGAFTKVLETNENTGQSYYEDDFEITGRSFRYKLTFTSISNVVAALRSLMLTMAAGVPVLEYELILDGSEFLNVDNEVINEEAFYDSMIALSTTNTLVNFVDNYQEQTQDSADATPIRVKVQFIEIIKSKPGESLVRLVVRED